MAYRIAAWEKARNDAKATIEWTFTTERRARRWDARSRACEHMHRELGGGGGVQRHEFACGAECCEVERGEPGHTAGGSAAGNSRVSADTEPSFTTRPLRTRAKLDADPPASDQQETTSPKRTPRGPAAASRHRQRS